METKIEQLWQLLEADKSITSGLIYRRLSSDILPNVYVGLKAPERFRCIAVNLSAGAPISMDHENKIRDIKIEILPDQNRSDKKFFLIVLLNKEQKDIFSTLCEDLFSGIRDITEEEKLIRTLLNRLSRWQSLFEKLGGQGLSPESQRGLYGELYFLRKFLEYSSDYDLCVSSWKGPEKAVQDFQHNNWAIEVKTTHGKNHQKIHITSERQLDTDLIPDIYLYHLSIDTRDNYGETLIDVIDSLAGILMAHYSTLNAFRMKLLEYGYFDSHRQLYSQTGYSIRQERIFTVSEGFPRIVESQIAGGVGDVHYSIVIADEVPWRISFQSLLEAINVTIQYD